ncbi:hypothetical protein DPMN_051041 [Dreissena polymorpha]|uniref:Uncharacterized protein n=1 Tax=Dreissena polymorpha TaxID=45954 RepID=A0A9D4CIB0_DREPO|nr:hypothetical protein DPMN_051024 [Dreissena polymorpha]KAH3725206.1 hypothetical protein DPMN_051041 [Dreissena polymorpha]
MLPEKGRCIQSQSSESIIHHSGPDGSPSHTFSKGKRNGDTYYSCDYAGHSHGYSRHTATTERRSSMDTYKNTKLGVSNMKNTPEHSSYWKEKT